MSIAGLLPGDDLHHLDHLAPLCSLLDIPLILTEESLHSLAQRYYPELTLLLLSPIEMPFRSMELFDRFITCLPKPLIDSIFFASSTTLGRKPSTIWCPHGNSDKGWTIPFMEALQGEELLLIYGERMRRLLEAKGVRAPTFRIGNYRWEYYQRHRAFYDSLLPFPDRPRILYAPTWQDLERSSSFEQLAPQLMNLSSEEWDLQIRPHPHLWKQYPELLQQFVPNLNDSTPCIYPILQQTTLLLGDFSSVGYDFLAFNRPMILLSPDDRMKPEDSRFGLARCGPLLRAEDFLRLASHITQTIKNDRWIQQRRSLYQETFDPYKITNRIHDLCRH